MEQILTRLAESLSDAEDLESLTRPLLALLEQVTGLESTYLTTIDQRAGVQRIVFSRNSRQLQIPEGLAVPWGDTLCKRAMEEDRPYTDDVAACWGDSDAARQLGIKTYVSQPVQTAEGALYGTLCAASAERVPLRPDTLAVLGMFAKLIAQQVERERLLEQMRQANAELASHALTDPLTGIANRRAMEESLQRMLAAARREGQAVQVAFVDLDGFKDINDRHGHDIGDRFLVTIARRLTAAVRPADLVSRTGGDEFVVLASGAPPGLRERLEQATCCTFDCGAVTLDYGGASVGVVESRPGEDAGALLKRADTAMYETKKARKGMRA